MRFKYRAVAEFLALFLICAVYRFVIAGKNANNNFYSMFDFTVNTQNYMNYILTATFYTLFFSFILNRTVIKMKQQTVTRLSREKIELINIGRTAIVSSVFCFVFIIPHIVFMTLEYGTKNLLDINFYNITLLQIAAMFLYFLLSGAIYLFVYYNTLSGVISCLSVFAINSVLMFAYRILKLDTPIKHTLIYTSYYTWGNSVQEMIRSIVMLVPVIAVLFILSHFIIKERDVL